MYDTGNTTTQLDGAEKNDGTHVHFIFNEETLNIPLDIFFISCLLFIVVLLVMMMMMMLTLLLFE